VSLSHQYRMNAEIMAISNQLVYGHRLKCGTAAVAERRLALPRHARLKEWVAASEVCGLCTAIGCAIMYCIAHTRGYFPIRKWKPLGTRECERLVLFGAFGTKKRQLAKVERFTYFLQVRYLAICSGSEQG
jgi:hypothetical protein